MQDRPPLRSELAAWWALAWPAGAVFLAQQGMVMVEVAVLGHLGATELAASSLAQVWIAITTLVMWSSSDALSALVAQAVGAGESGVAALWLQTCLAGVTLLCIPIGVSWAYTGTVLRLAVAPRPEAEGQVDSGTLMLAQEYATFMTIGLWPWGVYATIHKFLLGNGVSRPQVVIGWAFFAVNLGLTLLLVRGMPSAGFPGFGFIGAPIATVTAQWGQCGALALYARHWVRQREGRWCGWSLAALDPGRVKAFWAQALPLGFGQLLEEAQIQGVTVMAGRLGEVQVAAHSAMLQVFFLLSAMAWAVVSATSVRVGHWLGAGHVAAAKQAAWVALGVATVNGAAVAVTMVLSRDVLGRLYSSDEEVVRYTASIAVLCGAGYLALSVFYASMGVLEGATKPLVIVAAFLIGAWGVSFPLAYVFGLRDGHGLLGLWWGMTIGYAVVTLIAAIGVLSIDWHAVARTARARVEAQREDDGLLIQE